jgi:hypothetical protein
MKKTTLGLVLFLFWIYSASGQQAGQPLTNLTQEQVIEIAKEYAVKEGQDLSHYQKISAVYDKEEGAWDVSFKMDPLPPGGWFDVFIDDRTGEILDFLVGE